MTATFEDLVYTRLTAWPELLNKLAKYKGKAAVFYQSAPSDTTPSWKGAKQYPRIDYVIDMQADPERQSSGQATVNIWSIDTGTMPEEIEPEVRKALCGIFMTPEESLRTASLGDVRTVQRQEHGRKCKRRSSE